jgi:hypothetical protein
VRRSTWGLVTTSIPAVLATEPAQQPPNGAAVELTAGLGDEQRPPPAGAGSAEQDRQPVADEVLAAG